MMRQRLRQTPWILLLFLLVSACRGSRPEEISQPLPEVRTLVAGKQLVEPLFTSFGTVVQHSKADVYATSEGFIERNLVEEGMQVERGQVLARLDRTKLLIRRDEAAAEVASKRALLQLAEQKLSQGRRDVEARLIAVANAEAELAQKQTECDHIGSLYENKRQLYAAGGISLEELETVKTRYASAENELAQAEGDLAIRKIGFRTDDIAAAGYDPPFQEPRRREILMAVNTGMLEAERRVTEAELSSALSQLAAIDLLLEETEVRAPISGIIGVRYLDEGEKATPRERLFTIFNIESVYVQIDVSEKDLAQIEAGQQARVTLDRSPGSVGEGRVKLISPYVNPETRTSRVRIEVGNSAGLFTPGSFVRVTIVTGAAEEQVVLPADAVLLNERGESYVFLVRDNRLFKQVVVLGSGTLPGQAVICGGIMEGDVICCEPSAAYSDGMEVAP
jgi:multidrug efflux pump subunit AcrA (membrane-fusion protein)